MPHREPKVLAHRLAKNVRKLRDAKGITQEHLAELCGLHRTYVGAIERAERNVSLATLEALAQGLEVDPATLVNS